MRLRWPTFVAILMASLSQSRCLMGVAGVTCDESFPCPSGFFCDPTGHCADTSSGDGGTASSSDGGTPQCGPGNVAGANGNCLSGLVCNLNGQCAIPQYTEANGIVTDAVTGLHWQQAVPANPCSGDGPGICTQGHAQVYCGNLSLGGSGWRLPAVAELFSIVDLGMSPTIDPTAFPGTPADEFWTSTLYQGNNGAARVVGFYGGNSGGYGVGNTNYVRCVR